MMRIRCFNIYHYNDIFIGHKCEIAVGKVCLLVVEDFDSLDPCLKTENYVKFCLTTCVSLCPNMAERCRHKKVPPLFYLVCLRPFGAPSGRAYAQYRLCSLFMMMKHICDHISYYE